MWQRLNGPGNVLGKRKCLRAFMGVARGVTSEKGEREGEEVEKEEGAMGKQMGRRAGRRWGGLGRDGLASGGLGWGGLGGGGEVVEEAAEKEGAD
ncbi:hypothetical protein CYMTET_30994 [Cymbomonas tetramitiformis]|uniref:Uncharacterized protein n=1 Tax=Cymbomonas tetramitiformis TaxID=36881 RepID=A0AAE0FHW7_9CHLO|nr:hypothetical protein CYMTET_30994 [Cymbomonas tetramitiformis]